MNNSRAIVLNGLSRGGTNVLWNILQSHPQVCSPIYETGELIFDHTLPFTLFERGTAKRIAALPIVSVLGRGYLYRQFERWKLKNLQSEDNNTKFEGVAYSRHEIEGCVICFKGVDSDVDLNSLLRSIYRDVSTVVLVRNGYAVCNGWTRRGVSPREAGRRYASFVGKMLAPDNCGEKSIVTKFEELVREPFHIARRLFEDLELEPIELEKLRLKSKRILGASGSHDAAFGQEGRKYWFGPDEISSVLDPEIDARQIAGLSDAARQEFDLQAGAIMKELGYVA